MTENKNNIAKLSLPNGNSYELPIHSGTIGPDVIEIKKLYSDSDHLSTKKCVLYGWLCFKFSKFKISK